MPAKTPSNYNAQAHNDSRTSQRDVAALLSAVSHHIGSIRLEAIVLETKQDCLGIEFRPQLQAGLSRSCRGKSTGVLKASKLRTANVNWPCSQVGPLRLKPNTNPGWHSIWVVLENRVPLLVPKILRHLVKTNPKGIPIRKLPICLRHQNSICSCPRTCTGSFRSTGCGIDNPKVLLTVSTLG